ncbi:MAG: beta-phosphoglucomutase family hydrolase [Jatrophihabitantaceae bacterium]
MRLGLPDDIDVCLFDLDGVLTDTASVHAAAWKHMFDEFLRVRDGAGFTPFDPHDDYDRYVDGKPREDGVRDFLRSRGIDLPAGQPGDGPDQETVYGLGNRKNAEVQRRIAEDGVLVFEGSRKYLQAAERAGLRRFVVSSSANTGLVLRTTGLDRLVEGRIDGVTLAEKHIPGKPKPDSFLAGAALAGVPPARAVVFEDALAGVAAGRAGEFGYVVGVDRVGHAAELTAYGADVVVTDLAQLLEATS